MLSRFMRLLVLSLILLSLASPGFAARRSSLGGNLLIKDVDDIFFLPQRVVDYNRLVTFDYGTSNGLGSGGMIFGSERIVFGAFSHRSDFLGAIPNAFYTIGDLDNLSNGGQNDLFGTVGAGPSGGPYQWFDFVFGFQGGNNPMGLRLSVGRAQDDTNAPPAAESTSNVTAVDLVFGVSINAIELSGEVSFATGTDEVTGGTKTESSPVGFALAARKTAVEESEDLQLGWLGNFSYIMGGSDVTPPAPGVASENDLTVMALTVGVGPVYTPTERTTIGMYGTVGYQYASDKVSSGGSSDETKFTTYVIPGWNIAGEVELASWLQWRGGLVSRYFISETKNEVTGSPASTENTSVLDFSWHTGLGFTLGNFKLDGYIDPSVVTSGTDLLGESSDLFGMVTASYGF